MRGEYMRLSESIEGMAVKVVDLDAPPELRERLLGLGFVPGQTVIIGEAAPLGDPRVYIVGGKLVTLRDVEAQKIKILPIVDLIPLEMAKPGLYEVEDLTGGHRFRQKMEALGIKKGTKIRVIRNLNGLLAVLINEGEEVEIGRGWARKILVRRMEVKPRDDKSGFNG
ncbi:MAG: ferrous iron transport protein [Thermotogota bacterium]|nr:ferrous iron transport protein [Thermotogota bacterium]MDK2864456.1 ferrous iron transport protein [Thermotogota bacterium]HCZ05521.1 iron transporter FeoA [Thermotogota bacterium]